MARAWHSPLLGLVVSGCGTLESDDAIRAAAGVDETTGGDASESGSGETTTGVGGTTSGVGTGGSAAGTAGSTAGSSAGTGTGTGAGTGAATGTGSGPGTGATGAATSGTGPAGGDRTPLVVGQIGSFSGLAGIAQNAGRPILAAWVQDVNARGGLAGHPVRLYSTDDAGSKAKAQSAVTDYLQNKKVQALVGMFVPLTADAIQDDAEKAKVPVIGGDNAIETWFESPMFFPTGGTNESTIYGVSRVGVERGKKRVAMLYCRESQACSQSRDNARRVTPAAGGQVVLETEISLGQQSFTSECLQVNNARADNIIVGADGATIGRIMRDCTQQGYTGIITSNALAIVDRNKNEATFNNRLIVGSFVVPWIKNSLPAEKAYHQAVRRYAPGTTLSGAAALAWTSGEMLEAAVNAVADQAREGPVTRELILRGLYRLRNETLGGLVPRWTYRAGKTAPNQPCYSLVALVDKKWAAPITGSDNFRCYTL